MIDWYNILSDLAKTDDVIHSESLAKSMNLSIQSLRVTLGRLQKRGLVQRASNKIYINTLAPEFSVRDLATAINPESYVSLESALNEWGIYSQSPVALTCISVRHTPSVRKKNMEIKFHELKRSLFWGYIEKKTRYRTYRIAEPEKAILDWIYLRRKKSHPVELDEFEFGRVSRAKLARYAEQFPKPILQAIYPLLIERDFAA
jgi:predicted transcriptional regulator of viral defense system